ncbi:uncharacterized protein LOC131664096 [Phymastichus coffea]|uniref:uncharacterized protein LOC131664096 n=1 Tax=Phymastichus coffea TaxID=108790 RepID=UPI00273CAF99|nr:uncharacterized protein LOC131664096 [Phymastichus coffea]
MEDYEENDDNNIENVVPNSKSQSPLDSACKSSTRKVIDLNLSKILKRRSLTNKSKELNEIKKSSGTYTCPFCHKNFVKLPPHLEAMHSDEPEVKEFIGMKPKSLERFWLLKMLLNRGRDYRNEISDNLEVCRIPLAGKRQPKKVIEDNAKLQEQNKNGDENKVIVNNTANEKEVVKKEVKPSDYAKCPNCHGSYIRKRLATHVKKCINQDKLKGNVNLKTYIKGSNLKIHVCATEETAKLMCALRSDSIGDVLLKDRLIILYVNMRLKKYENAIRKRSMLTQIRQEARLIGRMTEELLLLCDDIQELGDAFTLNTSAKYEAAIEAVAGKATTGIYQHPSNATQLASFTDDLIKLQLDYLNEQLELNESNLEIVRSLEKKKNKCISFQNRFEVDIRSSLTKKASQSTVRHVADKEVLETSSEDVTRFYTYALKMRKEARESLEKDGFTKKAWEQLGESQLLISLIFNRKRVGDMAYFETRYYNKKKVL